MSLEMLVSSLIGFVPAIIILYILLRRYQEYLGEKNIFLAFAVGLVLGMIITVIHMLWDDFLLSHLDLSLLGFVVLFALFEELAKLIILNMPRLHLKYETVYYGAGLGLGIGSMAIVAISFYLFLEDPNAFGNPVTIAGLVLLSFNFCLLHSATGVIIGFGCAKGDVLHYFLRAFMAHALYNLIILPFMWGVVAYASLLLATLFAVFIFWYTLRELMPHAVPPGMQKKRRREVRKRVRDGKSKAK